MSLIWARSKKVCERPRSTRRRIVEGRSGTFTIFHAGGSRLDDVLAELPDLFSAKNCKTIKSEKKIAVVLTSLEVAGTMTRVYVKRHNVVSFVRRLASVFCASAAVRSFTGAATLLEKGYATARPLAAVEYRRRGMLLKSFYISEELPGAKTVETFWREDLAGLKAAGGYAQRRLVLKGLARLLKSLHDGGLYHNDLKASNILVLDGAALSEATFNVIDLQGLRKCFFVSTRRAIKNLAQLNRTLGACLTRTEKLCFFEAYGRYRTSSRSRKRNLVRRILDETRRQIAREKARHYAAENQTVVEAAPPHEAKRREGEKQGPSPVFDRLFPLPRG